MSHVTRLESLLDEQLANYERLHDLLAKKRAAIEANDLAALAKTAHAIEDLIAENNRVEAHRQEAAVQVMAEVGLADHRPTLARIIRCLPEPQKSSVHGRRERLRATLAEVARETRAVDQILRLNLSLVDRLIRTMFTPVPNATTYELTGASRSTDTLRLLDRQA